MKRSLLYLTLCPVLVLAGTARADPLPLRLTDFPAGIALVVAVIGGLLLLEVLVTTHVLHWWGMASVPVFFALILINILGYIGVALPLYAAVENVWLVEAVIVAVEGALIKLLSSYRPFQGATFAGLKWHAALLAALAGNACSYSIALLLILAPQA